MAAVHWLDQTRPDDGGIHSSIFVPLQLLIEYKPPQGNVHIHEIFDHNTRMKQLYQRLWFGDEASAEINIRSTFTDPGVMLRCEQYRVVLQRRRQPGRDFQDCSHGVDPAIITRR